MGIKNKVKKDYPFDLRYQSVFHSLFMGQDEVQENMLLRSLLHGFSDDDGDYTSVCLEDKLKLFDCLIQSDAGIYKDDNDTYYIVEMIPQELLLYAKQNYWRHNVSIQQKKREIIQRMKIRELHYIYLLPYELCQYVNHDSWLHQEVDDLGCRIHYVEIGKRALQLDVKEVSYWDDIDAWCWFLTYCEIDIMKQEEKDLCDNSRIIKMLVECWENCKQKEGAVDYYKRCIQDSEDLITTIVNIYQDIYRDMETPLLLKLIILKRRFQLTTVNLITQIDETVLMHIYEDFDCGRISMDMEDEELMEMYSIQNLFGETKRL